MLLSALKAIYPQIMYEGEGAGAGTPPPAGSTPPAGTPPPAGSEGPWYKQAGVADEHHDWLAAKQFGDLNTALTSYRSLEGVMGRERLAIPKDGEDAPAYDAIYKTLGRPDNAEGYKLPEGSKISGDEWKVFAPIFHEAGVSQSQAEKILGAYEKRAGEISAAAEVERGNQEQAQVKQLTDEWGSANEANSDIASRAFRALGIDEATSDAIESAIGYYKTMKLFHAIGAGMSEPALRQDGKAGDAAGQSGTVESLQRKMKDLFADQAFMDKYTHSDPRVRKDPIEQIQAIQKQIADLQGGKR